ncbi:hypothetical protein ANABIO32_21480 [Rossellomorea marisflavi]|nr:hypothetical protein ANABIO32_21480 [Rossellomorea marisflavi]
MILEIQLHRNPCQKPKIVTFIEMTRIRGMTVNEFWIIMTSRVSP